VWPWPVARGGAGAYGDGMFKLRPFMTIRGCAVVAVLATVGPLAAPAGAATKQECPQASAATLRAEGERFMTSMLGSAGARAGMGQVMTSMMGARGRDQAYEAMGAAARGCPATMPASAMRMMGAMGGMMAMMGGGAELRMMGGGADRSAGSAGMMDRTGAGSGVGRHDGWDGFETIMVVLMALLAGGAITGAVVFARWTRRPAAG